MKIHLLNDRSTFLELKNDEKNISSHIPFSAIAHLQNEPFTASSENVCFSMFRSMGENIIIFVI